VNGTQTSYVDVAVSGEVLPDDVDESRLHRTPCSRVALVARRKDRLDALVEQLTAEGIETVGFAADLSRPTEVPDLIAAIRDRFGRIDVIEYARSVASRASPRPRSWTRPPWRRTARCRCSPPSKWSARNWLYSLNGELAQIGAYAGTLSIAALNAGSEMGELTAAVKPDMVGPLVDPGRPRHALLGHVHQA
jgi:hypothetical protein